MRSLRRTAILGGTIWATLSVVIGGIALLYFFDVLTQRRFDEALTERQLQVIVALNDSAADAELMKSYITDPAYERPLSGRYWQVNGPDHKVLASRSLFDWLFPTPTDAGEAMGFWTGAGPDGEVRGVRQKVQLEDGTVWIVTVADSISALMLERRTIRRSLLLTLAFVGLLGVAGTMLQTIWVVRPLKKLREDVAHRWDLEAVIDPGKYPEEVAPLVSDINTLLERNREIVARGRRQAADMAHALKTPSAILRNELSALKEKKVDVSQSLDALDRIDAQLQRSLARVRAANSGASMLQKTNLAHSVQRLARLFHSVPDFKEKQLETDVSPELALPVDAQDLEEILGNILENAFQWSQSKVRLSARSSGEISTIFVEDDGPGIAVADRSEALRSGGRLDTSAPGTGLGLAIAGDLMEAYGGKIELHSSIEYGGLCVVLKIPHEDESVRPSVYL